MLGKTLHKQPKVVGINSAGLFTHLSESFLSSIVLDTRKVDNSKNSIVGSFKFPVAPHLFKKEVFLRRAREPKVYLFYCIF